MSTQRQPGYYFIKEEKESKWKPLLFDGNVWLYENSADNSDFPPLLDSGLYEINETRIVEPGEKSELIQYMQELMSKGIKFTYDPVKDELLIFNPGETRIITDKVRAGFSFDEPEITSITLTPPDGEQIELKPGINNEEYGESGRSGPIEKNERDIMLEWYRKPVEQQPNHPLTLSYYRLPQIAKEIMDRSREFFNEHPELFEGNNPK